jgi:hypothetical protein
VGDGERGTGDEGRGQPKGAGAPAKGGNVDPMGEGWARDVARDGAAGARFPRPDTAAA